MCLYDAPWGVGGWRGVVQPDLGDNKSRPALIVPWRMSVLMGWRQAFSEGVSSIVVPAGPSSQNILTLSSLVHPAANLGDRTGERAKLQTATTDGDHRQSEAGVTRLIRFISAQDCSLKIDTYEGHWPPCHCPLRRKNDMYSS